MWRVGGWALGVLVFVQLTTTTSAQGATGVQGLTTIIVDDAAPPLEQSAAEVLQAKLGERHGLNLEVVVRTDAERNDAGMRGCVFVGRSTAISSGMITVAELEAVKHDGYVIRAGGGRIALAGSGGRGTMYAVYRLLEHLGLKIYGDGRNGFFAEVRSPAKSIEDWSVVEKPAFDYRSEAGQWWTRSTVDDVGSTDGRHASVLNPELFTPGCATAIAEWQSNQHTATYLVPPALFHDEHPEYFAWRQGRRLPKGTSLQRFNICLSNPDVRRIATERMSRWMDLQPERRFFWLADQDGRACECDACRALERRPGFASDRVLAWVNGVARAVRGPHPDNRVFTLAYIQSVAPPFDEKLEPNVVAFYCPWWRDGRNCVVHDWLCPRNVGAMKQFMDWTIRFPDQIGVYDYGVVASTDAVKARQIKFLAKHHVRGVYFDGRPEVFLPLHVHITRSLLWNPYLDAGKLREEFLNDCYGPAAPFLEKYLEAIDAAVGDRDAHVVSRLGPLDDPGFVDRSLGLFVEATRAVEQALSRDEEEREPNRQAAIQKRIHDVEVAFLADTLRLHGKDTLRNRRELVAYRNQVARYLTAFLHSRVLPWSGQPGGFPPRVLRSSSEELRKTIAELAGPEAAERFAELDFVMKDDRSFNPEVEKQLKELCSHPDEILKGFNFTVPNKAVPPPSSAGESENMSPPVLFDRESQRSLWKSSGHAGAIERSQWVNPRGRETAGTWASMPLTTLPKAPQSVQRNGSMWLGRELATPLDVRHTRFLEIALHVTAYAPVSVHLETESGPIRKNTELFPGEQVVRIELPDHAESIRSLEIEFHPQGKFPGAEVWNPSRLVPTRDLTVTVFSMTPRNDLPLPSVRGEADVLWMSRSRSFNINRMVGRKGAPEPFRGYQSESELYPVYSIAVDSQASDTERRAAGMLREYMEKAYRVSLPVVTVSGRSADDLQNCFIVGNALSQQAGMVRALELAHVGPEGYVLHGEGGRVAIAGHDDAGTLFGVSRFLEQQGVAFLVPGTVEVIPDAKDRFMREVYLLDWPSFARRPVAGGWRLRASADPSTAPPGPGWAPVDAPDHLEKTAEMIKACARLGQTELPPIVPPTGQEDLFRYVIARLLWDPFLDVSQLKREFARQAAPR